MVLFSKYLSYLLEMHFHLSWFLGRSCKNAKNLYCHSLLSSVPLDCLARTGRPVDATPHQQVKVRISLATWYFDILETLEFIQVSTKSAFTSLHVLGVYMDWTFISIFYQVLQFLETQVSLMRCGEGSTNTCLTLLFLCINWPNPGSQNPSPLWRCHFI